MTTDEILRDYLTSLDALREATLGDARPRVVPTEGQNSALYSRFGHRLRYNTNLCTGIIILQCVIFAVAFASVLYAKFTPSEMAVAGSSSVAILLLITKRLQTLWSEKAAIDLIMTVAPELPASEVLKVAQAIYFKRQTDATPK